MAGVDLIYLTLCQLVLLIQIVNLHRFHAGSHIAISEAAFPNNDYEKRPSQYYYLANPQSDQF